MDFGLSETQEMVRSSAREFLEARESIALARKAHSDADAHQALWDEVRRFGWPGLTVPEEHGGSGLAFDDLCVLLEECASALMPGPLFETAVLGGSLFAGSDNERLKAQLLPKLADGEAIATLAHLEGAGRWDGAVSTIAEKLGSGWRIEGGKRFVAAGSIATHFVVSAVGDDGLMLFLVPSDASGVEVSPVRVASGEPYAEVELRGVEVSADDLFAGPPIAEPLLSEVLTRAATARAVQMAGAADAVVRRTIEYVSSRKQFGRAIGSFQAIQHRLADMATAVRGARHLARLAGWQVASGLSQPLTTARAKSYASHHLPQVCWDAHQLHGAIGFTWEHDLHLYTRRVLTWRAEFGDTRYWRQVGAHNLMSPQAVRESG